MAMNPDRELSVEELEGVAGGADANLYCPTSNEKSCNSECKPATASAAATASPAT